MGVFERIASFFSGPADDPLPKLGRNALCWCGSGKKYKRCHLPEDEKKRSKQSAATGKTI